MKRKIKAVAIIAAMGLMLASCGINGEKANTAENPTVTNEESVKTEKKYNKVSEISVPVCGAESFCPYTEKSELTRKTLKLIFEPLFTYDENMKVVPCLAESIKIENGGKSAVVKLKSGVKWHDGKSLSATDVLYSVNLVMNTESPYSDGNIEGALLLDKRSVRITFSKPMLFCEEALMFPIVRSTEEYVGTGPYKISERESSDTFVLSAYDGYYGEKPAINKIKMINCPNEEDAGLMFDIGETDVLVHGALGFGSFNRGNNSDVYEYPTNRMFYLGLNFDNSIFWGENTRKALLHIIDKNEIVSKSMYGKATVADFPINPSSWLYNGEKEYKRDTALATELLTKDSWTGTDGGFARLVDGQRQSFTLSILLSDTEEGRAVGEAVAASLEGFGIKCNLKPLAEEELNREIAAKNYDLFLGEINLSGNGGFEALTGADNIFGYYNSELAVVADKIRTERDEEKLKQLYGECMDILLKDVQFIPLFFVNDGIVTDNNILPGVKTAVDNPFYNITQWNR